MGADFYGILGVSKNASDSEIRAAYKKLALKHHPDRNRGQEDAAADKFKEVSRAFEVLSDPQKKRLYDQFGEEGLEGGGMGGGVDPHDLFSTLFGGGGGFFGGGGRRSNGPRKGKDLVHKVKVSLEELYTGKTTKLALSKNVLCSKCKGKGGKEGSVKTCASCNGQGVKIILRQLGPMVQQMQQTCHECEGTGEVINPKDRCKGCDGKKIIQERKVLEVYIDKGMSDGQTITFNGESDQAPNTIPGDVVIVVEEKEHPRFKRKGNDLYYNADISLGMALTGGQFPIEHLDDRILVVNILPGEIIKPDSFKHIPEQGMPAHRHHNFGRLVVHFNVKFPESLSEESIVALREALKPEPIPMDFPATVHLEEATLADIDMEHLKAEDAMDEDEHGDGHPGVACQNQ